jgi:hypothetical protein
MLSLVPIALKAIGGRIEARMISLETSYICSQETFTREEAFPGVVHEKRYRCNTPAFHILRNVITSSSDFFPQIFPILLYLRAAKSIYQ